MLVIYALVLIYLLKLLLKILGLHWSLNILQVAVTVQLVGQMLRISINTLQVHHLILHQMLHFTLCWCLRLLSAICIWGRMCAPRNFPKLPQAKTTYLTGFLVIFPIKQQRLLLIYITVPNNLRLYLIAWFKHINWLQANACDTCFISLSWEADCLMV